MASPSVGSATAVVADPDADALARDLSHDLMSPYCPGRTIASCSSGLARKLEEDIFAQAKAGRSREEIEATLVARFGPEIIGYEGRPILVYGTLSAALVAAALLFLAGRRWARRAPASASVNRGGDVSRSGQASDRERDRVENELDRIDEF